jgi:hypothetical protein
MFDLALRVLPARDSLCRLTQVKNLHIRAFLVYWSSMIALPAASYTHSTVSDRARRPIFDRPDRKYCPPPPADAYPGLLRRPRGPKQPSAAGKHSRSLDRSPGRERRQTWDPRRRVRDRRGFGVQYSDEQFGVSQLLHVAEAFGGTGIGSAYVSFILGRHVERVHERWWGMSHLPILASAIRGE